MLRIILEDNYTKMLWLILEEEEVSNGDLLYMHLLFTPLFPLVE